VREAIYGVFQQIEDARSALGQVKKASWNRAWVSVIYPESKEADPGNLRWETAAEGFIGDNSSKTKERWSGLKTGYLDGVGSVKYGSLAGGADLISTVKNRGNGLQQALSDGKVVAIVEAEPEAMDEVRLILENCGAALLSNQADA